MRSYNDLNKVYKCDNLEIDFKGLNSLDGCPEHITGDFYCYGNKLVSLIGGPQKVDNLYDCSDSNITDLVGCASHIGESLNISNNRITSLIGIHKIIKSCAGLWFDCRKIKEGGIGILLIEQMTDIETHNYEPFEIIKSYLGTGTKGMMECSKELKARGWDAYAKL